QDIGIESLYASKKHRLETSWSKVEQEQADAISEEQIAGLSEGRKNYCELPFVTIDSSSTKDIDDALYAEKAEQGWYIYIAIADPCAMIDAGSAIEKSLIKRASSVYFPGQTIAMLPEKLGSDICSLVEGKPRLAKVVKATVSETGDIESYELEQALIQSHKKLSYEVVGSFIDQGEALDECSSDIQESLKHLKTIADKRSEFRNKHNLIQKDRQEFY
ncbi:RNB domain-containing ribonuclease, partial [Oleiphilus sp. HI0043]|uniref:RNB domain-containing ribonuclease n=4 Tax=Oleiphilus TaxID=141450 RepID=UPI000AE7EDAC